MGGLGQGQDSSERHHNSRNYPDKPYHNNSKKKILNVNKPKILYMSHDRRESI